MYIYVIFLFVIYLFFKQILHLLLILWFTPQTLTNSLQVCETDFSGGKHPVMVSENVHIAEGWRLASVIAWIPSQNHTDMTSTGSCVLGWTILNQYHTMPTISFPPNSAYHHHGPHWWPHRGPHQLAACSMQMTSLWQTSELNTDYWLLYHSGLVKTETIIEIFVSPPRH